MKANTNDVCKYYTVSWLIIVWSDWWILVIHTYISRFKWACFKTRLSMNTVRGGKPTHNYLWNRLQGGAQRDWAEEKKKSFHSSELSCFASKRHPWERKSDRQRWGGGGGVVLVGRLRTLVRCSAVIDINKWTLVNVDDHYWPLLCPPVPTSPRWSILAQQQDEWQKIGPLVCSYIKLCPPKSPLTRNQNVFVFILEF